MTTPSLLTTNHLWLRWVASGASETSRQLSVIVSFVQKYSLCFILSCATTPSTVRCGEEAFEHYAPGVVEAVSGYSGGSNDNPTYGNHPHHFEVVLVEYDPAKSSYAELLRYAWRNIDPFDGAGQFYALSGRTSA
mmetsp:Transcript_15825/g.31509  ORF Transcript_15825/g.31509 Transcript_15825/m.31509 type:complete len:135 (-) Transcript_15825:1556-1960(-)